MKKYSSIVLIIVCLVCSGVMAQTKKPIVKGPTVRHPISAQKKGIGSDPQLPLLKPEAFAKLKNAAKGKVLVVNFWATWCGPCVAEFPEFVAIDAKYKANGVKVVGISADDLSDLKKAAAFLKEQKPGFENFLQDTDDPEQMVNVVAKGWNGTLPATFVFDKNGNPVYSHFGIINRNELIAAIEKAAQP